MPVRMRLARFGRSNLPFYRIFVADSRSPRDGRHLEVVGHFDPLPGKPGLGCCEPGCFPSASRARHPCTSSRPRPGRDGNKHVGLNFERIKCAAAAAHASCQPYAGLCPALLVLSQLLCRRYWLSVGAQPTERVARLLGATRGSLASRSADAALQARLASCHRRRGLG